MTPEDIERMCQDAIRRGADPVELERLRDVAMKGGRLGWRRWPTG
jgi:hypothetical protein